MAEILATLVAPWADGSSILSSPVRVVWGEGSSIYSLGGTYTPPSPPAGGTTTAPNLTARTAVAEASAYNQVPSYTVTDLRDGQPVPVDTVAFSTDEDALFWALSLTGGQSLYDKLKAGAQPATVAVVLNGEEWRFVIEDVPRQRRHGEATVRASGRSLTCLAGAPYEFEQNWSLDGDTTALQLAAAANANTGLQIEWGLVDWPIPDGVFSHTGTPLSVVKRVADAVGAMVQSDPKDFTVRVLPRYDLLPNEWPKVAPDAQLAEAALESEGYENTNQPAYDGVYVLGQQGGAAAFVRLAGTSGANLKPMVTDALLTDLVACQQRGHAELGRSGEQQRHTLTLPVYSGTGEPHVLRVGKILKVMETQPWWGVVRSVAVQAQLGEVSQTVSVERHTHLVDGTTFDPNAPTPLRLLGSVAGQVLTPGATYTLALGGYFADGVQPYGFSMRNGALPPWMNLDLFTGNLTGTVPGVLTPFNLQFRCTDSISSTADTNEISFALASGTSAALVATQGILGSDGPAQLAATYAGPWSAGAGGTVGGKPIRLVASAAVVMTLLEGGGLARSVDGGNTWSTNAFFTPATDYSDPIWDGSVWTIFSMPNHLRYVSSNGGVSWTSAAFTAGYPSGLAGASVVDRQGSVVLAARPAALGDGQCHVFKSTDGGLTWSDIVAHAFSDSEISQLRWITGSTWLFVNGVDGSFYRSTNHGATWAGTGAASSVFVFELATDGVNVLLLGLGGGLIEYSGDAGATWNAALLPPGRQAMDLIFYGAKFVALCTWPSTGNHVCVSDDGGATWTTYAGPGSAFTRLVALM